jgi:hypothetical protein
MMSGAKVPKRKQSHPKCVTECFNEISRKYRALTRDSHPPPPYRGGGGMHRIQLKKRKKEKHKSKDFSLALSSFPLSVLLSSMLDLTHDQ